MKRRSKAVGLGLALLWAAPGGAEIRMDQLSACRDLEAAMASLRTLPDRCRQPRDSVERAMVARIRTVPQIRYCWLTLAPTRSLLRFSCLRIDQPDGMRTLSCISPSSSADVRAYRDNYEQSSARLASDYTRAASACAIGNGNATRAVRTLMPFQIAEVARFDMGFALPVGRELVGRSIIIHGWGSLDPEIGADTDEIEFLAMYRRD